MRGRSIVRRRECCGIAVQQELTRVITEAIGAERNKKE